MALAPVRRIRNAVMKDLGLPEDMLTFVNYPTRFDSREAAGRAQGHAASQCPNLEDYAWRLWDYWERHLDPDLHIDRTLQGHGAAARWCWSPAAPPASAWRRRTSSPRRARSRSSAARDQDKLDEACRGDRQGARAATSSCAYVGRHRRHGRAATGSSSWLRRRTTAASTS